MPTKLSDDYKWLPTSGQVEVLVALIKWQDHATRPLPIGSQIAAVLNGPGVIGQSVWEYFRTQSQGRLDLRFTVTDWIDLPWAEADATNKLDLVLQHVNAWIIRTTLPVVKITANAPLILLHSGHDKLFPGSPGKFWSSLGFQPLIPNQNEPLQRYIISSALHGISGSTPLRPALIAHEIGHSLGLPHHMLDADTHHCVMVSPWSYDRSGQRPPPFCDGCKQALRWTEPKTEQPALLYKEEDVLRLVYAARFGDRTKIDQALLPFKDLA